MTSELKFKYFEGPKEEMDCLCEEQRKCTLCGRYGFCFHLMWTNWVELRLRGLDGRHVGCVECLKEGRFEFWPDTDTEYGNLPAEAFEEFARTPGIVGWGYRDWFTHCNDFMSYQGKWEPEDFYKNAPDGNGRALFMEMTDEGKNLWDEHLADGETKLKQWPVEYFVFKCLHCSKFKGYCHLIEYEF